MAHAVGFIAIGSRPTSIELAIGLPVPAMERALDLGSTATALTSSAKSAAASGSTSTVSPFSGEAFMAVGVVRYVTAGVPFEARTNAEAGSVSS